LCRKKLILNLPSRVEELSFRGNSFYIKRDDLIHNEFSGNKARKFHYYLDKEFPNITNIVSYGSNQSNAMYSLSALAKLKNWKFKYFVDHIPSYLKDNPQGNYLKALENGMDINLKSDNYLDIDNNTIFIEEGGRQKEAEYGLEILAKEIEDWQSVNNIKDLNIFLPSGTGTTALYLQKFLPLNTIYTTPCVGDSNYLKEQFLMLEKDISKHPTILNTQKKYHFGKLYREFYDMYIELQKDTNIEFDLLYDPKGFITILQHQWLQDSNLLYIHQGGLIGNLSMLPRYNRKYSN
jgi:1-aminocyclopropane-1-carboxylate deaminase/D-cysteine desulfhydrase-like pyridoxal-dependent ACC family enzyme